MMTQKGYRVIKPLSGFNFLFFIFSANLCLSFLCSIKVHGGATSLLSLIILLHKCIYEKWVFLTYLWKISISDLFYVLVPEINAFFNHHCANYQGKVRRYSLFCFLYVLFYPCTRFLRGALKCLPWCVWGGFTLPKSTNSCY